MNLEEDYSVIPQRILVQILQFSPVDFTLKKPATLIMYVFLIHHFIRLRILHQNNVETLNREMKASLDRVIKDYHT